MREASSLPEASNNDSCLKIEMELLYVEWNYKMISSRASGCGIILASVLKGRCNILLSSSDFRQLLLICTAGNLIVIKVK